MRTNGNLFYLLGDHLGSTSLTTDTNGIVVSEMRYKAWGETRYASGTTPTQYQYTGQYSYTAEFGLYFYNARWYDPALSRFAQADTIIPPGVQGWDRYAYTRNNPLRYTDPSGHVSRPAVHDSYGDSTFTVVILNVNLATSIPPNTPKAQEKYPPNIGIPSYHANLCGDVSLSMIYETVTGLTEQLGTIYAGNKGTSRESGNGSNAYEIGQQFANSFPAGWSAISYYLNYVAYFSAGQHEATKQVALEKSLTQITLPQLQNRLGNILFQGHYLIVGASLDTQTGYLAPNGVGHWVVVTGVSADYIYINNPYNNRKESYGWASFMKVFQHWILELVPPQKEEIYGNQM
jgi:RHS repeat-associated protein